ncbi:ComEC/Rec2 family competence protein, partial [Patescibacteria group bacterium]
ELPENFTDDFDYRMYLFKDKIYYLCKNVKFKKTGDNRGNRFYEIILKIKEASEEKIDSLIPAPEAGLADGLLFGGDGRLSQDVKDDFSRTGMTHIVAVSGYNVTIIAEYLMLLGIFLGLWRKQAFYFAVFGIFVFVLMIGMPSSAIRAGVMGTLLLWAMKNGRIASSYNAIALAGAIMIFVNPLLLRWDIGFQLSFLATLGIVVMGQFWERYFSKKNDALGLLEVMFMTVSAQIFVLPIITYNFHTFSVVSVLVNVLVLQVVPISMFLVFMVVVFGFIFYPLSVVFSWLAYLTLWYEVEVIRYFSGFDWASREVNNFRWWGVLIWYVVLVGVVYIFKRIERKRGLV